MIYFVIRITIITFDGTERLAFPASRNPTTSDPEEDLKVKSNNWAIFLNTSTGT
jgi:hypothetical protein